MSVFPSHLFNNLPGALQGILRVSTTALSGLVSEGLRYRFNQRGDQLLSGVPAFPATGIVDTVLPYVVVGEGYGSQIVLLNRPVGTNVGSLKFTSQGGTPMFVVDLTAPTVGLTSPGDGLEVSGTIDVTASATDNVGIAGVQFLLDGAPLGAEDTTPPFSVSWNTTLGLNKGYLLSARARDTAGNQGFANR